MAADPDNSDSGNDLLRMVHSFVIKVWQEEAEKGVPPNWRGHITHVPGNERRYLKSVSDISDFVQIYLHRMGVRVAFWWRFKQWLKRRKST